MVILLWRWHGGSHRRRRCCAAGRVVEYLIALPVAVATIEVSDTRGDMVGVAAWLGLDR